MIPHRLTKASAYPELGSKIYKLCAKERPCHLILERAINSAMAACMWAYHV